MPNLINLSDKQVQEIVRTEKRKYMKNWRKNNPNKVKASQDRYWLKKAQEAALTEGYNGNEEFHES